MNLTSSNASNFGKHFSQREGTTMNLTSINGNAQSSTWKNLKTRYVVAAAGIALAVSAVVSVTPWQHGKSVTVAPAVAHEYSRGIPTQVFYIVGSEYERDLLSSDMSDRVFVKGSADEALLYSDRINDLSEAGISYRIVDHTRSVVSLAWLMAPASEADIYASVISTERANFADVQTQPLFANALDAEQAGNVLALESAYPVTNRDADIMASVISTERAAYAVIDTLPTPATFSASEADIYASVLSTERANFAVVEHTQPLFANAADAEQAGNAAALESAYPVTSRIDDVMASIISTECAAYGNPERVQPLFGTDADAEFASRGN